MAYDNEPPHLGATGLFVLRRLSRAERLDCAQHEVTGHRLLLATDGHGQATVDGRTMQVREGAGLLLKPGMRLAVQSEYGCPLHGYDIGFDALGFGGETEEEMTAEPDGFPYAGELEARRDPEIAVLAEALCGLRAAKEGRAALRRHRLFVTLLERVWDLFEQARSHEGRQAIDATLAYMEASYHEDLTRDRLAERAGMSPGYFSAMFRKETGKSPMEALTEIRVNRAKERLLTPGLRLKDIARQVGFNSEFYFSSRFKQVTGLSPSSYVKRNADRQLLSSQTFTAHVRAARMERVSSEGREQQPRVLGLFVEDDLMALGIKPVLQFAYDRYYQRYLEGALGDVDKLDMIRPDWTAIRQAKPDLIMLGFPTLAQDGQYERFAALAPTYVFCQAIQDWRRTLLTVGELVGRHEQAAEAIGRYETKTATARALLRERIGAETVALVRLHHRFGLIVYGGTGGYACPVLYGDLALTPPPLLREWRWDEGNVMRQIKTEVLRELDADHLFLLVDEGMEATARRLRESDVWGSLRAVRGGQVYGVRPDIWLTFGILAHERKVDNVLEALI